MFLLQQIANGCNLHMSGAALGTGETHWNQKAFLSSSSTGRRCQVAWGRKGTVPHANKYATFEQGYRRNSPSGMEPMEPWVGLLWLLLGALTVLRTEPRVFE